MSVRLFREKRKESTRSFPAVTPAEDHGAQPPLPPWTLRLATCVAGSVVAAASSGGLLLSSVTLKRAKETFDAPDLGGTRASAGGWQRRRRPRNMFDCDSLPDEECTYFRPVEFFESDGGGGHPYLNETAHWRSGGFGLPNDTHFLHLHGKGNASGQLSSSASLVPRDLVYVHTHKNGGKSVKAAMTKFARAHKREYELHNYFWAQTHTMSPEKLRGITSWTMGQVVQKQKRGDGLDAAAAFTFLRDPVQRFLSSIGEVMKQKKMPPCSNMQGIRLADCAVSVLTENGLGYNVHFKPQVAELYDCAGGMDVVVSLLDMGSIDSFAGEGCLGLKEVPHKIAKSKHFFPITEGKGGGDVMSLLDDSTMRRVCELYEVDVVFFRSVGRKVPQCDPFIANVDTAKQTVTAG